MASNRGNKKVPVLSTEPEVGKERKSNTVPRATTISAVVPVEALAAAQWDQETDDVLAAALRNFFLSHTLDPLTGEVHTVH